MNLWIALGLAALAASIYLLLGSPARPWAVVAAIASGMQVAIAFGWVSLRIANIPLHLVISLAIAVCGAVLFARVNAKGQVAAATVVIFVGIVRAMTLI
jgi:hypothetical protein